MKMIPTADNRRIKHDAEIAIDALQSIRVETTNTEAFPGYILEKVARAKRCLEFIENTATRYKEADE